MRFYSDFSTVGMEAADPSNMLIGTNVHGVISPVSYTGLMYHGSFQKQPWICLWQADTKRNTQTRAMVHLINEYND
jgi:hypothetical protein